MKKLLLAFFIFCSVGISFGQQVWENKELSFSIQKPENWFVAENKKLIDILKTPDLTDRNIDTIVEMFNGELLVRFQKYNPKIKTTLNPSIQIQIRPKPADDFQGLKKWIIASAEELKQAKNSVEDFKFIEEIREVEISGIKSIFFVIELKKKTKDETTLITRAQMLGIPYKNYFFRVNFIVESDGQTDENCTKVFDELIKTIKIGK